MFKTDKPVAYPADPDQVTWDYEQGSEFRDPSSEGSGRLLRAAGELVHARPDSRTNSASATNPVITTKSTIGKF